MKPVLGIDPGSNTGMALYEAGKLSELWTTEPWQMDFYLTVKQPTRVIFEDSRLQSYTWSTIKSRPAALKMARNVGEIDAWCKLIVALCANHEIPCHGISPKNKGAKLNAEQFAKLTGWTGKTNEHTRDSAMVAWPYRGAA